MAHILFVDDEPSIRETLPKILTLNGHTVVTTATVAEALVAITSERFDLLISDLNIGHPADGFIVVSAMRRTNPECVNFILTGYPGYESALQAIREQVDGYMVKPTNVPKLLKSIEEGLKAKRPREARENKRLSMIVRENIPAIVERALADMRKDPELGTLSVTDAKLVDGLPDALRELANVLDLGPEAAERAELETRTGQSRERQTHALSLMVHKNRITQRAIVNVIYDNLLSTDMSHLMRDMAQLNDAFLWQLASSVHGYFDTQPIPVPANAKEPQAQAQEVHGSAEQFQAIIDSAMDTIISLDARQRIVLFNKAAEKLFGYSAHEVMGKSLDLFLPEHVREIHRRHVEHFGATGVTCRSMRSPAVLKAVRRNGEQFPIEATISQVGEGDQKRYTVIMRDITQRLQTERALIQSEKLASISHMSAALAHEINNPLEGLKNLLYVMMCDPSDTEMVRKYADLADTELNRVADIARQVLGQSRGGDLQTLFRLSEVMDAVLALIQRKIDGKGALLQKEYRGDAEVHGVSSEIRQVLWNLLINSIDAIPNGGRIRVRVAEFHRPRDGRKGVRITLADNGAGISSEHMPRVFDPFYTTKSAGNGLGLWVAKQIIDSHDGSIRLRSQTNGTRVGTVFSIFLPS
jgi:PAS domain S-box-containing protein